MSAISILMYEAKNQVYANYNVPVFSKITFRIKKNFSHLREFQY